MAAARSHFHPGPGGRLPATAPLFARPILLRPNLPVLSCALPGNLFRLRRLDAKLLAESGVEIVDVVEILAAVLRGLAHPANADQVEDDLAEIAVVCSPQLPSTSLAM